MFVRVYKNQFVKPKLIKAEPKEDDRPNANVMVGLNTHIQKEPTHLHIGHTVEGGAILNLRGGNAPLLLKSLDFNKQPQVIKGKGLKTKGDLNKKIEKIKFEF